MGKVVIRHWEEVEPTLFTGRESRRIITPEDDNSTRVSLHRIDRFAGLSNEIMYAKNDEILYVLEGEGYILEDDKKYPIKAGCAIYIPENSKYRIFNCVQLKMLAVLAPARYREEWKSRKDLVMI